MKHEIKVPAMGESISEATVSAIIKPAGSYVKVDDEIIELATDKVNQVLYAQTSGVFTPTVKEDDTVKIGDVLGMIDDSAEKSLPQAEAKEKEVKEEKKTKEPPTPTPEKNANLEKNGNEVLHSQTGGARGSVQNFIKEIKQDKEPASLPQESKKAASSLESPKKQGEVRKKMSKIRKVIAERLVNVQHTTAMLTTFNEVDLTEVIAIRQRYKELFAKEYGTKLGFMSFFVKASVEALKKFPALNSYIDGDEIVERQYFSIGVAVGTDKGVVVPVLKNCDELSFADIEKSISGYAVNIKEGKIKADDLQGAGFTITNGGTYGSLLSTPIVSPNQCAILGMHKIEKRPVVIDDKIVIRDMMYLALSYDHRIIDGKEAVSFLVHIKNLLEDPSRMLLERRS